MSKQYQARLQQEQRVARRAADTVARQQRSAQARLDADAKAFHKATESFRKHWEQHLYQHDQGLWIALKNGTLPRQELQATLQRIAPRPSVLLQQHWYQQQQQQQQQQSSRQRQPAPQERVLPQAVDPWAAHPVDPTSKGQRKYAAAKPLAVPHPPRTNAPVAQPSSAPVASKDVADVRNRVTATADSMIKGAMSAQMDVMEQFREAAAAKGGPGVSLEDLGRMALQAAARGQFATPEDVKARGDAGKWGNIVGLRAIEAVVDGHIRAGGKLTDDQQTLLASIGRHQSEAMVSLATSLGQPLSKSAAYQGGSLQ
jgi:DNA polymerase III gamma/tau subunit